MDNQQPMLGPQQPDRVSAWNLDLVIAVALRDRQAFEALCPALLTPSVVANPYQRRIIVFYRDFLNKHDRLPADGDIETWVRTLGEQLSHGTMQTWSDLMRRQTEHFTPAAVVETYLPVLRAAYAHNVSAQLMTLMPGDDTRIEIIEQAARELETISTGGLLGVRADQVEVQPMSWVWEGRIPVGLTIIDGDPDTGKSQLCAFFAACMTRKTLGWRRGRVLIIAGEDVTKSTTIPRLTAAGADLSQVKIADEPLNLAQHKDLDRLRATIDAWRPDMVMIDPISAYSGNTDSHRDPAVRQFLMHLEGKVVARNAGLLITRHFTKDDKKKGLYRGQGSIAWVAKARAAYAVVKRQGADDTFTVASTKMNIARKARQWSYRIEEVELEYAHLEKPLKTSRIVPLSEEEHSSLGDVLDAEIAGGQGRVAPKRDAAEKLLLALRERFGDEIPAIEALQAAEAAGLSEKVIRDARKTFNMETAKTPAGPWVWRFPPITGGPNSARIDTSTGGTRSD